MKIVVASSTGLFIPNLAIRGRSAAEFGSSMNTSVAAEYPLIRLESPDSAHGLCVRTCPPILKAQERQLPLLQCIREVFPWKEYQTRRGVVPW